ncbi:MAG: hypothetical protein KME35_22190 [Aphanocapsa sp. GSE-SYN-MK-11-07L]|nr:hypothetical protein [Aphanocapsa sp. GSE-SYN-MK-11-07L]
MSSPVTAKKTSLPQTAWQKKAIRGIYLSRYQVTNNANEQMIRQRVRTGASAILRRTGKIGRLIAFLFQPTTMPILTKS